MVDLSQTEKFLFPKGKIQFPRFNHSFFLFIFLVNFIELLMLDLSQLGLLSHYCTDNLNKKIIYFQVK